MFKVYEMTADLNLLSFGGAMHFPGVLPNQIRSFVYVSNQLICTCACKATYLTSYLGIKGCTYIKRLAVT